jgi:hypothetical protein
MLIGLNAYPQKPYLPTQCFFVFFYKKNPKNLKNPKKPQKTGQRLFKKYKKIANSNTWQHVEGTSAIRCSPKIWKRVAIVSGNLKPFSEKSV